MLLCLKKNSVLFFLIPGCVFPELFDLGYTVCGIRILILKTDLVRVVKLHSCALKWWL